MLKRSAQALALSPGGPTTRTRAPERATIVPETRWRALWRHLRHGWCRHRDLTRIKVEGIWYFRCTCGYQRPIVQRTADERARCRRLGGSE
jgi:hypothetical protein